MNKGGQRKRVSLLLQTSANETSPTRAKVRRTTAMKTSDYPTLLYLPIEVHHSAQAPTINKNLLLQLARSVLLHLDLSLPPRPSSSVVILPLPYLPRRRQYPLIEPIDLSSEPTPQPETCTCQNENAPTLQPSSLSRPLHLPPRSPPQLLHDIVHEEQPSHSPLEPQLSRYP